MNSFRRAFKSATVKLTSGFLLGIMLITVVFSFYIYKTTSSELDARLEVIRTRLQTDVATLPPSFDFDKVQLHQISESHKNIIIMLVYANITILIIGGVASYLLARRVLEPIEAIHESQSRFTSDASHELRTPLAVMKTEMEVILRDKKATKPEYKEVITSSLEEVDRLSKLSNTLLKLARLEDITIDARFDLTKATKYALKIRGVPKRRYELHAPSKPLMLRANEESITELLLILIDNALNYSPDDSKLVITLFKRTTRVGFTIQNEGKGIATDDLRRIFQRFYRADSSRTRTENSGHGLGLALAKRIVEVHDGELTASSAISQPTTFAVRLPAKH